MKSANVLRAALLLIAAFFVTETPAQGIFYGDSTVLGDGVIRTWTEIDSAGNPVRIGFTMTYGALNGLPNTALLHSLGLPDVTNDGLFDHVFFGWAPNGHIPGHLYATPHFDVHFYTIPHEEREEIPGAPDPIPVPPQYLPENYYTPPPPFSQPRMGVHYLDSTSAEFLGEPFTSTLVLGYYRGDFLFVEPMVTRAFLLSLPDASWAIPQPQAYQRPGFYPTTYRVRDNFDNETYEITLENFTAGETSPVADDPVAAPSTFALLGNYPNPFNPSTTIAFALPHSADVTLTLYNLKGEAVAVLAQGRMAEGRHEIPFTATSLATGMYFYRLQAAGFDAVQKMLLVK